VAHEEDDTQAYGVRVAGFELLDLRLGLNAFYESLNISIDHSEPLSYTNLCYLPGRHSTGHPSITESTRKWIECVVSNLRLILLNPFLKVEYRWKPLEASLAAIGSQSEEVLECIEDEQDSGRPKPIDVEDLLANVIPSILHQSGMHQAS
jgi:hypothetical protein